MKLLLRSILFFALASFAPGAFGQSVWNGSVDDNWATSGNWTPSGEPSATTNALINIAATINLPGTATSVGNLNITTSTVGLTASTSTFTDTLLTVNAGGTLNLIIPTGGTVSSSNTAFVSKIGDGSGTGTLNLTGTGTLSFPSGTNNTEDGIGGTGIINQSIDGSSTTVNVNATLRIGADGNVLSPPSIPAGSTAAAGGTGTYNLGGTAILNATTIDVGVGSGTGGGTTTGGSTPTVGTLNITSTSATALTAFAVNIGTDESATGATIANTTGLVNQSAGTATMTILRVGLAPGTGVSGAYNLSGTGILNDLNTISIGSNLGASGSFQQSAGTTVTTPFLFVGEKGMGNYALQGGTLTVNSNLNIGETAGANGILTQSAGSTLIANGTFDIGTGGTGDFKYNGGTLTLSSGIAIGANGTFDQNSSITLTNPATQAVTIAAGGSYNLNAGTLTTGGTTFFTGAGNFNFAGGTVLVSSPWLDSLNGTISGTSTINTAGNPVGLSGNLTGTGTLDFIGGGFIDLSGTNNGVDTTWGAQINGVGTTLIADTGVANLSALGSFVIGAGATLNVASSGNPTDTFAGSISGAGNFITGQNDTAANKLILSGTTNLTGASTTTIGAGGFGTLEVDNGTISNVNGSAGDPTDTFDVGSGTSTGTVTLLGTNSLGRITVHTGSTLLAGNVSGDIANTGTLGTLGTPNAPATLSITGRLLSNGTLLVNENGITADEFGSGLLTIAKLSGIVKVVGFGTITNVVIVDTTGGVTIGGNGNLNDPAGLTTNPPTALFSSTLSENGADTQLLLSTVQNTLGPTTQFLSG